MRGRAVKFRQETPRRAQRAKLEATAASSSDCWDESLRESLAHFYSKPFGFMKRWIFSFMNIV